MNTYEEYANKFELDNIFQVILYIHIKWQPMSKQYTHYKTMLSKSKFEFSSSIMAKKIMSNENKEDPLASSEPNYAEEEQREVSSNLHHLRKIYDKTKDDVKAKQKDIDQMDKELEQLDTQAQLAEGDTSALNRRTEQLKEAIKNTIANQDSELLSQRYYEYMLIRMRQSLLMIKINTRKVEESLSSKAKILDEEQSKEIKNKEQLKQAQNVLKTLMDHVDKDNKNRSERIEGLRRTIHNKEDAVSRRLDRLQRQKDIVEKAADNQEQSEVKLRENLLVQKFWNSFLKRKMGKEMEANSQIEDAFQKIRTATGITDIQEIMKKFVSREQTYSQLLFLVGENEKKLNDAKIRNKDLTEKLNQARIVNVDDKSSEGSSEIEDMYKEIENLQHDLKKVSIKHQSTHIVLGQLSEWVLKIMSKVEKILSKMKGDEILSKSQGMDSKDPISVMITLADVISETFSKVGFADASSYNIKNYAESLRSNAEFQKMVRVKARAKSAHKSEDGQSHSNKPYESEENNGEKESREINVEIEDERRRIKKDDDTIVKQMKEEKKEIKKLKKKEDADEELIKEEPENK